MSCANIPLTIEEHIDNIARRNLNCNECCNQFSEYCPELKDYARYVVTREEQYCPFMDNNKDVIHDVLQLLLQSPSLLEDYRASKEL